MRTPYGWLLFPLLAACAGNAPTWHKAGASESATNDDLQQCRVLARQAPESSILAEPMTRQSGTPMIDRGQERDAKEAQDIRACMQRRGYSLTTR
ncbi:MAG TPA: hypothetical protein VFZ54_08245 [Burkholderiales bacterium]